MRQCRIFYRCVDWNIKILTRFYPITGRIFYRCVDWNTEETKRADNEAKSHLLQMRGLKPPELKVDADRNSRIFYRCVDWNWKVATKENETVGRIFYRCVDWNLVDKTQLTGFASRIFYRCVDWNLVDETQLAGLAGRIFYRCVDWNLVNETQLASLAESHLLQMRGLKLFEQQWRAFGVYVASFTDAWIETIVNMSVALILSVASFTDAWIETISEGVTDKPEISRIFYRCVDWNLYGVELGNLKVCRIFYRCVDWNSEKSVWWNGKKMSHLLQMRGLKHIAFAQKLNPGESHLLQMRGLKRWLQRD